MLCSCGLCVIFLQGLLFKVKGVSVSSPTYNSLSDIMLLACAVFIIVWISVVLTTMLKKIPGLVRWMQRRGMWSGVVVVVAAAPDGDGRGHAQSFRKRKLAEPVSSADGSGDGSGSGDYGSSGAVAPAPAGKGDKPGRPGLFVSRGGDSSGGSTGGVSSSAGGRAGPSGAVQRMVANPLLSGRVHARPSQEAASGMPPRDEKATPPLPAVVVSPAS